MKTRQEIAKEIFEQCKKEIPQVSHFKSGGVFRLFIEIIASFLEKLYQESENLLANRFLQTASGEYLTLKSKELGIEGRFPAQKTQGYVVFSRKKTAEPKKTKELTKPTDHTPIEKKGNNITIDANKIIATKANTQGQIFRFKVLQRVILTETMSEIRVLVEAEEYGSDYNVPVDTITEFITNISGVDTVSNSELIDKSDESNIKTIPWISQPGRDIESDDDLRIRCLSIWQGLSGANKGAYIAWAKSVSNVEEVKVMGTTSIVTDKTDEIVEGVLGDVTVICTSKDNKQPGPKIIADVKAVIESKKPIATEVFVLAPKEEFISLKIAISTSAETLSEKDITEQVTKYFSRQSIGQDFEPSALSAYLFILPDIKSVVISEPSTGVSISNYQIARLKETDITITTTKE